MLNPIFNSPEHVVQFLLFTMFQKQYVSIVKYNSNSGRYYKVQINGSQFVMHFLRYAVF